MRYLLLSDIHANLHALTAVLEDSAGQYDSVWFLGDVVGYGPHPNECIEILSDLNCLGIAGNHDWAALGKLGTHHFNPEAHSVLLWTRSVMTHHSVQFLEALPTSAVAESDYTLVHGSPRQPIWEYILHPAAAVACFDHFATPYCLVGHTHGPMIYESPRGRRRTCRELLPRGTSEPQPLPDPRLILNPGSVGQPRDGDPRASYMIVDSQAHTVVYRRVTYDVETTQEAMLALDFPARLIYRLMLGL